MPQLNNLIHSLSCCLLLVCAGCRSEVAPNQTGPSPPATEQPQEDAAPTSSSDTSEPAEVKLEVVDKQGFQQALERAKGKVVLVDVWATWCVPCRKSFPQTVELHNKFARQGLAVISLSMDDDEAHAEALEFLKEQKAQFTNLRSKQGAEPEAFEAFDIDGASIPHFKLYDRTGKPVKKFFARDADHPIEHSEIEKAVEELVAEK
jgi:thiol-disulfide isomerase/thioredoxin